MHDYQLELDKSGYYVLIKVCFETRRIGLKVVNSDHMDEETFWGTQCQEVYGELLTHSLATTWFTDMTHVAYVGKELKKAEIALATGGSYYQE